MDRRASSPLRVVHAVASANFAGVERYLSYVAPELSRRGVEVVVVGGEERRMAEALAGTGVRRRGAPRVASVVRALLAERRAHVVHAHMTSAEVAAAMAKPLSRSRLVATRHFAAGRGSTPWGRAAGRAAARAIDRQIAVSRFVAAHVEGEVEVLLTGVPAAEPGAHDRPLVLAAQRMEAEKGGSVAIEAWALSGLGHQGWSMAFAGDGAGRRGLERLAGDRGVSGSVRFLGFVEDLGSLMGRASVLLAPTPAEAFGLSVVEAMARALPVVAAAGGGHLETAGAAVPESLFPPGDAVAAAALLRGLAGDAGARRRQGERLRRFQREALSVERHVDRLMGLYASLA